MTLRVGIVSAGWGAFAHLPAWRAIPGVEVTAICTSREETARAAARAHGIARPFWDALEMCADPDIDIVDLGTRPIVRLPMVLAALEARQACLQRQPARARLGRGQGNRRGVAQAGSCRRGRCLQRIYSGAPADGGDAGRRAIIGEPLGGSCHFSISLFNAPDKRFPYNWFADGSAGVQRDAQQWQPRAVHAHPSARAGCGTGRR